MDCIGTDNFSYSSFENNTKEEQEESIRASHDNLIISSESVTPHVESLHSFSFSSPSTTSINLAFALGNNDDSFNKERWNYQCQKPPSLTTLIDKNLVSPQPINQGLDSSSSSNESSNPVTPDDREPIHNTPTSYRRHRTFQNTIKLYPSTFETKEVDSSRYLPQNQAVITTQDNWRVSLSNHIATLVLSGSSSSNNQQQLVGKHILDFIGASHRPLLLDKIVQRREDYPYSNLNGNVLICGDIIPIVKQDGTKSFASLWLKEKKNENGSSIFIWIFEQVFQSTIQVVLDDRENIISMDEGVIELFGYTPTDLFQKHITTLVPNFDPQQQFFGATTKLDAHFPIMVNQVSNNIIRILSMPTLAGLVTVKKSNGIISSCNAAFSKYLFGQQHHRQLFTHISSFIPQFNTLIACLKRDELLQLGYILNNLVCRNVLSGKGLTARHRDGTLFDIELQIKLLEDTDEYALWISFDRESVFTNYGHTKQQQPLEEYPIIRSRSINIPTQKKPIQQKKKSTISPALRMTTAAADKKPTVATAKITSFSKPSFTSTKSAIEATKEHMMTWPNIVNGGGEEAEYYSAQTLEINIEDYEILDELGQGAYGLVKLAYLKKDPEKKRVVIKYVIKSRILIDCWTRDRKLGLVPAEIHVLHTLRNIPHTNCSDMLDYFEDQDYYYVVMDLFGAGVDLFDYIELKNRMSEVEIKSIFRQVVAAVGHLHDHRIVHRDIKDENVILDLKGGVKLIDFGSAAYIKEGRKYETFVGTLDYAAPEILKGQAYAGPPQDIWACGTLLYTLIYRENPFYNIDEIMENELRIPFILSEDSVDLISKMLDRNLGSRLNIHQVLEHPWFQSK